MSCELICYNKSLSIYILLVLWRTLTKTGNLGDLFICLSQFRRPNVIDVFLANKDSEDFRETLDLSEHDALTRQHCGGTKEGLTYSECSLEVTFNCQSLSQTSI